MAPQVVEANAKVVEDYGRGAVQRGPLVYCLEQLDQPHGTTLADVSLRVNAGEAGNGFTETFEKDLLDGVVVLQHQGAVQSSDARRALYFPSSAAATTTTETSLTFIPYYAWSNRAPTAMMVWTPLLKS